MPLQNLWRTIGINIFLFGTPLFFFCGLLGIYGLNKISGSCKAKRIENTLAQLMYGMIIVMLGLLAVTSFAFISLGFSTLYAIATAFAPDQQITSFTQEIYSNMMGYIQALCWIAVGVAAAMILFRQLLYFKLLKIILVLAEASRQFTADSREFLAQITFHRLQWWEFGLLTMMTVFAGALRWNYLDYPMHHDEAYTFIAFASRSLAGVISDYHLPNNHVLHSILVHYSTLLFGIEPWAVRFPAFLCGVLCVPGVFILSKVLYDRKTAFLCAIITATLPFLVEWKGARGYTLLGFLTLISFSLGVYIRATKNLLAWFLLALVTALGFYDIPVMLYPAGAIFLWLFLSMVWGDIGEPYSGRPQFFRWLMAAGLLTVLLTGIFYMPVIIGSGAKSLLGNSFIESQAFDPFLENWVTSVPGIWQIWTRGILAPGWLASIGLMGMILFNRRLTGHKVPLFAATVLWIGIDFLLQRPQIWSRVWSFIVPLLLVWISAGLLAWIGCIKIKGFRFSLWICIAAIILVFASGLSYQIRSVNENNERGIVEEVVINISSILQEGDIVFSTIENEPQLWYYFRLHEIPEKYLQYHSEMEYQRVFIVIYEGDDDTPETLLAKKGIEIPNSAQQNPFPYQKVGEATIFTIGLN